MAETINEALKELLIIAKKKDQLSGELKTDSEYIYWIIQPINRWCKHCGRKK